MRDLSTDHGRTVSAIFQRTEKLVYELGLMSAAVVTGLSWGVMCDLIKEEHWECAMNNRKRILSPSLGDLLKENFDKEYGKMNDANTKFWMVLGNGPPNVRHDSYAKAEFEARRLAAIHTGQDFYVMESMARVSTSQVVVSRMK
jgi:hypothetical protein